MTALDEFIDKERKRFEIGHNNMFAKSFGEINRYYFFLKVIVERQRKLIKKYSELFDRFQKTIDKTPGSHNFTREQVKLDREMTELRNLIQLEVESFYQFAKILLDKTALAMEFYFGKDKSIEIHGHRSLIEKKKGENLLKIEIYAGIKSIKLNKKLLNKMREVQKDISDFRDNNVTHLRSPRTIRGVSTDGKMLISMIYSSERETNLIISKPFAELIVLIREYVDLFIDFVKNNKNRTALEIQTETSS